jgi:integrase
MADLISPPVYGFTFCMAGHIRTLQKCPTCGKPYPKELVCCNTRPTRYFIDIWWKRRLKIYTDPQGYPLDSYARTEQLLSTIRHQIGAGKFDPADFVARELKGIQFINYAFNWLERRQLEVGRPAGISRSYFKEVKRYVQKYFTPFFGRLSIRELRKAHIIDFKNQLPEHLSPKTVANILGVLHRLLAEALDRKDITVMPGFPKLTKVEPKTKWINLVDQEAILSHCREPYKTLFLFCMKQGCRVGEARALKWEQVILKGDKPKVTICASMDLGVWKPYTKEGDVRELPLNLQVKAALLALPRSLSGFVFVNQAGRPLSDTRVRTHWNKAAAAAGVDINCYQGTRHSFATQKLISGHSERKIMEVTGHKTTSAFRRYGKMVTEALREVVEDTDSVRILSANKKPGQ